jgi:uncharacterized membrane protein
MRVPLFSRIRNPEDVNGLIWFAATNLQWFGFAHVVAAFFGYPVWHLLFAGVFLAAIYLLFQRFGPFAVGVAFCVAAIQTGLIVYAMVTRPELATPAERSKDLFAQQFIQVFLVGLMYSVARLVPVARVVVPH